MTVWHRKRSFQKLRREWYAKLKENGFRDIEQDVDAFGTSGGMLLGVSAGDLRRKLYKSETEDYYRFARQYLHTMPTGLERAIWQLHSEGVSMARGRVMLAKVWGKVSESRWYKVVNKHKTRMLRRLNDEMDEKAKEAMKHE